LRAAAVLPALFITLFAAPFVAAEVFVIVMLSAQLSVLHILLIVALVVINALFYYWLKAPTHDGRLLLDRIEGLKLYLSVAEQDRLNLLAGPRKTPELFEKFLPYALALDVENAWAAQFDDVLRRAGEPGPGRGYSPAWYSGRSWTDLGAGAFAAGVGAALTSAVAASATAPGSSSGGGGGGSSGGGGGGGGGGGW